MAARSDTNPIVDPIGPTEVGIILKCRYHKARDLMMTGKLGPLHKEGREMTVSATAVIEFDKARRTKHAS